MIRTQRNDYTPIGEEEELSALETEGYAIRHDNPNEVFITSGFAPSTEEQIRWDHIQNLDEFFKLVYEYHQQHGFLCILLKKVFGICQFAFVVIFATFLMSCVNYSILFSTPTPPKKTQLSDAVLSPGQCVASIHPALAICLLIAALIGLMFTVQSFYRLVRFWDIRTFYKTALNITSDDLVNMTWHDVLIKLLEVQREMQLCVHKNELNELDVYNRILRFKNYLVAMINKGVLPVRLHMPMVGNFVFLTNGYLWNITFLLFWGPWALFENYWHVRTDVKQRDKRQILAQQMRTRILRLGLLNLFFAPFVLLFQIFYSFFKYTELLKREPGRFGLRRWSLYGRLFLRHFNELDHEFISRLNRAHSSASKYMNIFSSRLVVILAKNVMFFIGSMLAVLIALSIVDEDMLQVEHVVGVIAAFTLIVTVCRSMIPDENMVWCPETLLLRTLADIHYMPDHWKGQAHSNEVRIEFSQLFQYQILHVIEELVSPIVTPFVLIFWLRPKAEDIIDFMRNFTLELPGVGDICSFAQLDVRKHGHPMWLPPDQETEAGQFETTEHGKIELSLMHFHMTNPHWQPPTDSRAYLDAVRHQVQRETSTVIGDFGTQLPPTSIALASMFSTSGSGMGLLPDRGSILAGNYMPPVQRSLLSSLHHNTDRLVGGISGLAGPNPNLDVSPHYPGVISAMQESIHGTILGDSDHTLASNYRSITGMEGGNVELMAMNMNMSTLYIHELHHRRRHQHQHQLHIPHTQHRMPFVRVESPQPSISPQQPASPLPSLGIPPSLPPLGDPNVII